MDKCGVSTEGLISDADYFTTLAFVKLADNGERNFAFARKPGADIGLKAEEVRKDIICQSRILHVGSLSLTDEISRNAEFIALKAAKIMEQLFLMIRITEPVYGIHRKKPVNG